MPPQLTNLPPTIRALVDDVSPVVPDAVEATLRVWLPTLRAERATAPDGRADGQGVSRHDGAIPAFVRGRRSAR